MKVIRLLVWIAGTIWLSLMFAVVRGFEFGFEWDSFPTIIYYGFVWGCPAYLFIFAITKGGMGPRLKSSGIMIVAGFLIGMLYMGVDEYLFSRTVQSRGLEEYQQERWWPSESLVLMYTNGEYWVMD